MRVIYYMDGALLEVDADRGVHDVTVTLLLQYDRTAIGGEIARDGVGDYAFPTILQINAWSKRLHQNTIFLPVKRSARKGV